MKAELDAGANMVIAEAAREANVGIYRGTAKYVKDWWKRFSRRFRRKILWEAPNKAQQVFFIKLLGSDVNLGNIPVNEVIPLETLRVGLRGDTMKWFLGK